VSILRLQAKILKDFSWVDLFLLGGIFIFVYGLIGVAANWTGPYHSRAEIDLHISALPRYAFFSLVRGFVAYGLSLIFTTIYGYFAAHSKIGEKILIPLLDILQSIPVLGFLPGLVLALVALFPDSNIGLELACILMIFTGQVWNMTFSFYTSIKGVPQNLRDVTLLYRMRKWDVLRKVEIPSAMNGLLWNSMVSMAGGWFFLMVVESFTLGEQNFRVPGIGSYMAVAVANKDGWAIFAGIAAMFSVIILVDRCLWAPLVSWSTRFMTERPANIPTPLITKLLDRSGILRAYIRF